MERDWHHLPTELLEVIGKKVTSIADYIRFRAVCHPWQYACSLRRPDHLPLQLPWLMLPYRLDDGNDDSTRLFYDLSASKIHKLDLPQTCGASICGSSHGWLFLQKGQVVSLLNPITRATISLPPFSGPPSHIGIAPLHSENFFENWEADQYAKYAINPTDKIIVYKAILTSAPQDPNCLVFVLSNSKWRLAFCQIGDKCWTVIEFDGNIWDFTYSNGFLYTICRFAAVTMYNFNNQSRTLLGGDGLIHHDGELEWFYLVEGVSGDILLIQVRRINVNKLEHTVYKLSNDGVPEWFQVIDVGQNVLFFGGPRNALSLSSANLQLPEWGANCLCYDSLTIDKNRQINCLGLWYNHNIKLARLDNGTVTDITGDFLGSFQLNWHWQKSLWLTPSLF